MDWTIRPYQGAGPIDLGIKFDDLCKIIGYGGDKIDDAAGFRYILNEYSPIAIIRDGIVEEISFSRYFCENLLLQGVNLLKDNGLEVIGRMNTESKQKIYESYGFLIFFDFGVALSGFHNGDEEQKAVSIFRNGVWDEFRNEMTVYKFDR